MMRLRALLLARRWPAVVAVVFALAVRIVVPAGMMPGHGPGGATLVVCSGHAAAMAGMAMPAKAGGKSDPAKADMPCAFTGLIAAALDTAALPVLPAMPLPVHRMRIVEPAALTVRTPRLRPPLRGPPEPGIA